MEDQQQMQNLEVRLRRLEQLHLWGVTAILIIGIGYFMVKSKK